MAQAEISCEYTPNQVLVLNYLLLDENETPPPQYEVVDLTGATFRMMVRSQTTSPDILAEASTSNGKIVQIPLTQDVDETDPNTGITTTVTYTGLGIEITFDGTDTLNIYNGAELDFAIADLEMTLPSEPAPLGGILCVQLYPLVLSTRDYPIKGACP